MLFLKRGICMKKLLIFVLLFLVSSSAFAYMDSSLFSEQKTVGYYLLSNSSTSSLSSGLVYSKKQDNGRELNVVYTSFRSAYLLTRNITKLDVYEKIGLTQLGLLDVYGLLGLGLVYSPAVGGGLTFGVGGSVAAGINEALNVSMPVLISLYSDGFGMQMSPTVNFKPDFLNGYEAFVGFRMDASMLSSNMDTGRMNMYYILGAKKAI